MTVRWRCTCALWAEKIGTQLTEAFTWLATCLSEPGISRLEGQHALGLPGPVVPWERCWTTSRPLCYSNSEAALRLTPGFLPTDHGFEAVPSYFTPDSRFLTLRRFRPSSSRLRAPGRICVAWPASRLKLAAVVYRVDDPSAKRPGVLDWVIWMRRRAARPRDLAGTRRTPPITHL